MFRQWNQKFIRAAYNYNEEYGQAIKVMEKHLDMGNMVDETEDALDDKLSDKAEEFSKSIYAVLMLKAEKETYDKLRPTIEQDGIKAYCTGCR